jgi:Bacterial TniB protein
MTDPQNFCAGTKEGWSAFVHAEPVPQPERLTRRKLAALSSKDKAKYDHARELWHANMGTLRTPRVEKLLAELAIVLRGNVQSGEHAKGAVVVEGDSFLGKTTLVQLFAKEFHRREIDIHGEMTDEGDERWPVAYVTLTGHPSMRDLNASLLHYFAHAGGRGAAGDLARRALDTFLKCNVRLLIIDDLHFLRWESGDGSKVSNHLKYLVNEFPITMLLIGTDLTELGLYRSARGLGKAVLGPTARRTTSYRMEPYQDDDKEWRSVVHAIERNLVLARHKDGILTHQLSGYLLDRSTGYMGSLVTLINRSAVRAIVSGAEAITEKVLEDTVIDIAAEKQREEAAAQRRNRTRSKARRVSSPQRVPGSAAFAEKRSPTKRNDARNPAASVPHAVPDTGDAE